MHQKVLQYPIKSDNKGRVNAQWKMKTFPFPGFLTYDKSYPVIVETSLNSFSHSKMMTAVTSHLFLPELISEMPPGSPKDILYGETHPSASLHLQILHFSFYFMFWATVVGSVACKRVLWNTTVIFITNK